MILSAALTGTPPASTYAPLASSPISSLISAAEHFRTVDSYRVTIRSTHDGEEQHIRYSYKKPGFVRMEFIRPHDGALLIYNPDTKLVHVWPFGAGHFPDVSLSPTNPLIQSLSGIRVDQSDVGVLFENLRILRDGGTIEVLGEQSIDGRTVWHLVVTGAEGIAVAHVHRSELWLDTTSQFPVKIISHDLRDYIIESVTMEELEINNAMPETLFNP